MSEEEWWSNTVNDKCPGFSHVEAYRDTGGVMGKYDFRPEPERGEFDRLLLTEDGAMELWTALGKLLGESP